MSLGKHLPNFYVNVGSLISLNSSCIEKRPASSDRTPFRASASLDMSMRHILVEINRNLKLASGRLSLA